MPDAIIVEWIRGKYVPLKPSLNERARRLWAATEARSLGRGGIASVVAATGVSSATVNRGFGGLDEAAAGGAPWATGGLRKAGAGRKALRDKHPGLSQALLALVESTTRGDPEQPLRWTCKSTSK